MTPLYQGRRLSQLEGTMKPASQGCFNKVNAGSLSKHLSSYTASMYPGLPGRNQLLPYQSNSNDISDRVEEIEIGKNPKSVNKTFIILLTHCFTHSFSYQAFPGTYYVSYIVLIPRLCPCQVNAGVYKPSSPAPFQILTTSQ